MIAKMSAVHPSYFIAMYDGKLWTVWEANKKDLVLVINVNTMSNKSQHYSHTILHSCKHDCTDVFLLSTISIGFLTKWPQYPYHISSVRINTKTEQVLHHLNGSMVSSMAQINAESLQDFQSMMLSSVGSIPLHSLACWSQPSSTWVINSMAGFSTEYTSSSLYTTI